MIADGPEPSLGPVTLGDLFREGKLLWVYCCDCMNPATIPFPAEMPVPEVGKHMNAPRSRMATIPPAYSSGRASILREPHD